MASERLEMGQLVGNYNARMRVRGCSPFHTGIQLPVGSTAKVLTEFLEFLSGRLAVLLDWTLGSATGDEPLVVLYSLDWDR